MATLELNDIQGIIRRGYGDMYHACFVLLEITDAGAAKHWLRELVGAITDGENKPPEGRLNIAFTFAAILPTEIDNSRIHRHHEEQRQIEDEIEHSIDFGCYS